MRIAAALVALAQDSPIEDAATAAARYEWARCSSRSARDRTLHGLRPLGAGPLSGLGAGKGTHRPGRTVRA